MNGNHFRKRVMYIRTDRLTHVQTAVILNAQLKWRRHKKRVVCPECIPIHLKPALGGGVRGVCRLANGIAMASHFTIYYAKTDILYIILDILYRI